MSLQTVIRSAVKTVLAKSQGASSPNDTWDSVYSKTLDSGVGAGQADVEWHDTRTLNPSASETLDLAGSLVNGLGQTFAPARIKLLEIRNNGAHSADILVLGAASSNAWNGWTSVAGSTFKVGPGGLMTLVDPSAAAIAITAGTADQFKVANSGTNTVSYDIRIVGASA